MNINIKATKIELTPAIKDYIQEKMDMLEKYLKNVEVIGVHFEVEMTTTHHHKGDIYRAEVNMRVPGELLRIEKTEADLYKAIDKVKDHLAEMIKKYKDKKLTKKREAHNV